MGSLGAAQGVQCSIGAAVGSTVVGSNEHAVAKSARLGFGASEFVGSLSPQRASSCSGSSTELKILIGGRQCHGLRHTSARLGHRPGGGFRSRIVCQALQDSENHTLCERHCAGESTSTASESSCDGGGRGSREEQEIVGTSTRKDGHHLEETPNFRIGRRMLLGAVSVGLSAVYTSSSSSAAGAKGFKFSLTKGSWFLGDSERETESDSEKKESDNEKKESDSEKKESDSEKKESSSGEAESRVYDATVLGEPVVIGSDNRDRVWTRLLENRVVYLGEAETVADADDKLLELEIVRTLRDRCFEQRRGLAVAFEVFPTPLQPQLNSYLSHKLSEEQLRAYAPLSDEVWQEYLPILQYCRSSGVRLVACGAPLEILRTVQAAGVQALSRAEKEKYIPPAGGGYKFKSSPLDNSGFLDSIPNKLGLFGPGPYRFAQARIIQDFTMAQVVSQAVAEGGGVGLLLVITGASHVQYGARGTGLPAWIAKNKDMQKRTQAVVLLNPERQYLRNEGDLPEADFLWYSAAKVCKRNCFDRAEVARVMGAAGIRRDALPQDLQLGLKQGLVAPEVLQSFFELEQNPIMAELTGRFQGLRERWFADPRFLERLAIEETISITTTLIAQFQRRGERFWDEIDYVATDTIRGAVVDFFTVWLPAPRLSFRELNPNESFNALDSLKGLLGSFPDNAFQRPQGGENWGLGERVGGILVGGLKLFGVGFVSSIGTLAGTNFVLKVRQYISPQVAEAQNKRSPILKTALVYGSFLATSANLRYQVIAGVVEHWVADYWLASQPIAGNVLSFVARTANSYFGTAQWVDLARYTGLQAHGDDETEEPSSKPTLVGESKEHEMKSEPVSASSAITHLARITGLQQAHSDETDPSSNLTSVGMSDDERNSEPVSTSSSSAATEDRNGTPAGTQTGNMAAEHNGTQSGSKTGSTEQVVAEDLNGTAAGSKTGSPSEVAADDQNGIAAESKIESRDQVQDKVEVPEK